MKGLKKILWVVTGFVFSGVAVAAVPQIPEDEGVNGYIAVGAGYIDLESNTISGNSVIDLDNDRLTNITDSPDGRDTTIPVVIGEVTWTLANRNQLFFGTSVEDAVTLDGGTLFGWRKGTENIGTFQVGAVTNRLVPLEVYEDPFVTGSKRKKTDQTHQGVRLEWDRIWGTGFGAQLQAREIEIDKERSCFVSTECGGLSAADIDSLERDADETALKAYYTFNLGGGHQFRPIVAFKDHDADGDAEDFESVRAQLTYAYLGDRANLVVNASWADQDYDNINPLYGIERDADVWGIDATLFYKMDIWDGNWSLFANGLYGEVDSDIDFYDLEVFRVVGGVAYRWK